ncbi:MAG: OmpH family outer membrane protein [Bacteroidales bacterium]|jgi:outer membrane protein|nr:OmpH family outer membrane protein [Bacteroidales bacterium]
MKRYIGITTLVFVMVFAAQAQNLKFGHINSDELIRTLPEFDTANAQLEKFRQELINNLEIMTVELNNKSDSYNKESKNLTELVRQTKEQELIDLNRRIQEFQVNAQEQLQNRQVELFQPIYTRVEKVISDVGRENGFLYIFDVAKGSLLYFDESNSTDVLVLVKAKLGLK